MLLRIELSGCDTLRTSGGGVRPGGGGVGGLPQGRGEKGGGAACEKHLGDFPGKLAVRPPEKRNPDGAVRAGDGGTRPVGGLVFRYICP